MVTCRLQPLNLDWWQCEPNEDDVEPSQAEKDRGVAALTTSWTSATEPEEGTTGSEVRSQSALDAQRGDIGRDI